MDKAPKKFLQSLRDVHISNLERAVALLWWYDLNCDEVFFPIKEITNVIHEAGYAKQNKTRLNRALSKDKRIIKRNGNEFRIKITAKTKLSEKYSSYLSLVPLKQSDSVLPKGLFNNTRGYIEKVVNQINLSFDYGLYDCCTVMCRRLLETLVIETYEELDRAYFIKDSNGNYLMFSKLLKKIETDDKVSLSRNGLRGLKDFKTLGDLSAHNRRFNARKTDIKKIRTGIRVSVEELLHISGLVH